MTEAIWGAHTLESGEQVPFLEVRISGQRSIVFTSDIRFKDTGRCEAFVNALTHLFLSEPERVREFPGGQVEPVAHGAEKGSSGAH